MTTRDQFLERVRGALKHPAAPRYSGAVRPAPEFPSLGQVMAPVSKEALIGRFAEELEKVGGVSHEAGLPSDLDRTLREVLGPSGGSPTVLSRNPLLTRLGIAQRLQAWGHSVLAWPHEGDVTADELRQFRDECFSAKAGITGADLALVESGSFVLTSATEGSQLVSLAPPVHIILYRRSQVVETLEEVLDHVVASSNGAIAAGRSVVFITGQSRTADIEQISIRGVHGPLRIHAILVEEACLTAISGPG